MQLSGCKLPSELGVRERVTRSCSHTFDLRRHFIAQQVKLVAGLRGSVTAQLVRLGCNDVKRIQIPLEVLEGKLGGERIDCICAKDSSDTL